MKHEELIRETLKVMCDSLGAEWDIDRLVPMVLSASRTVSSSQRRSTVAAIQEIINPTSEGGHV